ncbi:MAG: ABC transporter permease, partial [Ilumatobacter sp.]
MVGVLGLSESSKSALLDEISALGTNLLTVESGVGIGGGDGKFPEGSLAAVNRIETVETASAIHDVETSLLKSEFI